MAGPWDNVDYEGYLAATKTEPEMHGVEGWCRVLGIEYVSITEAGKVGRGKVYHEKINITAIFDEIINRINLNYSSSRDIFNKNTADYLTNMHPVNGDRAEWDPNFNRTDDNMSKGIVNRELYTYQGIQQLLIEQDNSWDYTNPPPDSIIYHFKREGDIDSISLNYIIRTYDNDGDGDMNDTINWVWAEKKYTSKEYPYQFGENIAGNANPIHKDWNSCDPWIEGTGNNYTYPDQIGFISSSQYNRALFINWPTRPPQIGSV